VATRQHPVQSIVVFRRLELKKYVGTIKHGDGDGVARWQARQKADMLSPLYLMLFPCTVRHGAGNLELDIGRRSIHGASLEDDLPRTRLLERLTPAALRNNPWLSYCSRQHYDLKYETSVCTLVRQLLN
jgi:hypothetical protein